MRPTRIRDFTMKNKFYMNRVTMIVACIAAKKFASIKKQPVIIIGLACIIMLACSSPESDGIKAAKIVCDCQTEHYAKIEKIYESYIKNFNSYSFKTRIDARQKLNETLNEINRKFQDEYQECYQKAREKAQILENKYLTNEEDKKKFQFAFNAHGESLINQSRSTGNVIQEKADAKIKTIIPPKPDIERLKKDMIGRSIAWGNNFASWSFKEHQFREVQILGTTDNGDDYILDVHLTLVIENHPYAGVRNENLDVTYTLGASDDWFISNQVTKGGTKPWQ